MLLHLFREREGEGGKIYYSQLVLTQSNNAKIDILFETDLSKGLGQFII